SLRAAAALRTSPAVAPASARRVSPLASTLIVLSWLRSRTKPPGGDSALTPLPPLETRSAVPVWAQSAITVRSAYTEGSTTTDPLWVSPLGLTASATRRCSSSSMALSAAEAARQRRQQRL